MLTRWLRPVLVAADQPADLRVGQAEVARKATAGVDLGIRQRAPGTQVVEMTDVARATRPGPGIFGGGHASLDGGGVARGACGDTPNGTGAATDAPGDHGAMA